MGEKIQNSRLLDLRLYVWRDRIDGIKAGGHQYLGHADHLPFYHRVYGCGVLDEQRIDRQYRHEGLLVYSVYLADGDVYENCHEYGGVVRDRDLDCDSDRFYHWNRCAFGKDLPRGRAFVRNTA